MLSFCLASPLGGCADAGIPHWITGEPDMKELYVNRAIVASPPAQTQPWPNLADVPSRRADFSPTAERKSDVQNMSQDHQDATRLQKTFEETPPPALLPLPPTSSVEAISTSSKK